jgi:hypothetical protein
VETGLLLLQPLMNNHFQCFIFEESAIIRALLQRAEQTICCLSLLVDNSGDGTAFAVKTIQIAKTIQDSMLGI